MGVTLGISCIHRPVSCIHRPISCIHRPADRPMEMPWGHACTCKRRGWHLFWRRTHLNRSHQAFRQGSFVSHHLPASPCRLLLRAPHACRLEEDPSAGEGQAANQEVGRRHYRAGRLAVRAHPGHNLWALRGGGGLPHSSFAFQLLARAHRLLTGPEALPRALTASLCCRSLVHV